MLKESFTFGIELNQHAVIRQYFGRKRNDAVVLRHSAPCKVKGIFVAVEYAAVIVRIFVEMHGQLQGPPAAALIDDQHLNEYSDYYCSVFYGDKDTFHLAWR